MLLTTPCLAVLAEPRHHVGMGYSQWVNLRSSLGSGSSGIEVSIVKVRWVCNVNFGYVRCEFGGRW